jgi:hypothetical protein
VTGTGSERRILVIGSQCRELNHLSFLPVAAEERYAVLMAPDLGGCVPTLPVRGLWLDPTVAETREALETAFERASTDEATLLLVYIGHGGYGREGKEAQQRRERQRRRQVLLFAICYRSSFAQSNGPMLNFKLPIQIWIQPQPVQDVLLYG